MKKSNLKKLDILLMIVLPILAAVISLIWRTNYLTTTLLFFAVPSIWFSVRTSNKIWRTALFSILVAIPLGIVLDYLAVKDNAWWSPTIFPGRLFGILPYEDFIWGFWQVYLVIILYEHFLDKGKHRLAAPHFRYFVYFLIALLGIFFVLFFAQPSLLDIPYAYLWIGVVFFLLPVISFVFSFPKLLSKFIKVGGYFLLLHIIFEFTALELGNWVFLGKNYIKLINFGSYSVPLEEIVVWWLLCAVGILAWYEFFDDDQK